MNEKTKQSTVGEILKEGRHMEYFKWKIKDFLSLPDKMDYFIESPQFSFMNASWHLRIYPNGESKHNNRGWIGLYLIKDDSATIEHVLTYILAIEEQDGGEHSSFMSEYSYKKNKKECGLKNILQKVFLMKDSTLIDSQNTVTFSCTLFGKTSESAANIYLRGFERYFQDFESLCRTQEGSDVVLSVKNTDFKAHKAILTARSPVFRSMFMHDMQESNSNIVDISDCDPVAFEYFLFYLYCGRLEDFPASKVFELYYVTDKYDASELKNKCLDFLKNNISLENFYDALMLALRQYERTLLQCVTKFFIEREIDIIRTAEWLTFLKEYPVEANELHIKACGIRKQRN